MSADGRGPLWLSAVGRLVPADERDDWLAEWRGELAALDREEAGPLRRLRFALGTVPHAVSLLRPGGGGWPDVRYAIRILVRRPRFTLVAALTLALGIAVNGALFSLVNGLLLRPPPAVDAPDRLIQLARSYDDAPRWDNFSWPALETLRSADHLFSGVAGSTVRSFVLGEGAGAELVAGAFVTGDWFDVLGVRPAAGRLVLPDDDLPGAPRVVVLSHGLWTRFFGGDPAALGSTLRLGGEPHRVIGVAPAGFTGVDKLGPPPDLFVPTSTMPPLGVPGLTLRTAWGASWIDVVARLRPGGSTEAARAGLDGVSMALRDASSDNADIRVLLAEGVGLNPAERDEAVRLGWLMAVVSGLVLVLTCANVAGLFLARAVDRRAEFAVRRTLGAGGTRIARQLLTESALLAALATALAAPLLLFAGDHLAQIVPASVAVSFAPDRSVWLALVGLGLGAGLLFGGVPAVLVARRAPARGLGSERTATGSRSTHRIRSALVVGQLAVSLGLLAGAGLLVQSVRAALDARPGLDPSGVMAAVLDLELTGRYDAPEARIAFLDRLVTAAEERPEIESAAVSSSAPFLGPFSRMSRAPSDAAPDEWVEAEAVFADAGWFDHLGVTVVEGRGFDPAGEAEPVALVNQSLARRFWPDGGAVGRHLAGDAPIRVVGVVADARHRSLRSDALPAVYEPLARSLEGRYVVQVRGRTGVDETAVASALRAAVAELDPSLPVPGVHSLRDRMAATLGETRALGTLVVVFAGLALVLGALGLYTSVAYAVARRTRELAVRMAVGARPEAVFTHVVLRGLLLAGVGVGLGLLLALALGRALQGTLYGIGSWDAGTLLVVAVVQGGVALTATAIPARRVIRVDPARALREDL